MSEKLFPKIIKSIEDFLYEEEGNITRNKVLTIGSMMLIMGVILGTDAFAAHRSHSSHKSHSSHSSHSSGSGGHSSHESHVSHTSHVSSSGGSHSSHSSATQNVQPAHSNVVPVDPMPSMSGIGIKTPPASDAMTMADNIATSFTLPDTPKIK